MSEEETKKRADIIRGLWASLISPSWKAEDLKDLGVAIYMHTPVQKLSPKQFGTLFPYLNQVVEKLTEQFDISPKTHTAPPTTPEVSA